MRTAPANLTREADRDSVQHAPVPGPLCPRRATAGAATALRPICGLVLLLALAGCGIPLSTLHGPRPTPANNTTSTVGFGPIFLADAAEEDFLMFSLIFGAMASVRHGVSERLEVGGSVGMFNGLTAEAKYNLVPGPLYVSANLALSTGLLFDIDIWGGGDGDTEASIGLHPALLVGTERIYGGAKLITFPGNRHVARPWTVVFAGGSLGGTRRIVPEIAWLHDPADGESTWIAGIGLRIPRRHPPHRPGNRLAPRPRRRRVHLDRRDRAAEPRGLRAPRLGPGEPTSISPLGSAAGPMTIHCQEPYPARAVRRGRSTARIRAATDRHQALFPGGSHA
jgi:hypothetical protein